jgi:3',5'-cyclic AMP phosphodiesterase CpdA
MARVLHISDVHFGWPTVPEAVEAIHACAGRLAPDVVACSGDLVQRGDFSGQFRQARAFLDRFDAPVVSVPGNHDIPLWNPLRRLARPFVNYRRFIHDELEPVHRADGVVICGLNSVRPWLVDLGYLSARQLERVRVAFADAPADAVRVVMAHHPLAPTEHDGLFRHHVRGARRALRAFAAAGADVVLCGHSHFPTCRRLRSEGVERHVIMAQSGTSASSRFRPHTGCVENAFNVIETGPGGSFRVEHHHLRGDGFEVVETETFERV